MAELPTDLHFGGVGVNLQYLACLLRLGDILDFDRSRTPRIVFEGQDFTEEKSWKEWNKHLAVTGWKIDATTVAYQVRCTQPSFYVAVQEFLGWIDEELRACRFLIDGQPKTVPAHYQLTLPMAVDRRGVAMEDPAVLPGGFRFQLEYEEILHLLMDKSLYPDESLFLRELLQNALDACRRKEAEAKYVYGDESEHYYQPRIVVFDHSEDPENPRIEFMDNGVGMSLRVVEQYFLRVGKSYYRSKEFEAERARYEAKGIELDACSQFGIGVLSCFMVADRLRVVTVQHGHDPLSLEVDGPAKYFVIRKLPRPASPEFDKQPANAEDDGPPGRTGTRVVVCLRRVGELDVLETLAQFAVNVDFSIMILRTSGEPQVLPALRWERLQVPSQALIEEHSLRGKTSEWHLDPPDELFVQANVPLDGVADEHRLRGAAWFWLLRGKDNEPTVRTGLLHLGDGVLGFDGLALLVQKSQTGALAGVQGSLIKMLERSVSTGRPEEPFSVVLNMEEISQWPNVEGGGCSIPAIAEGSFLDALWSGLDKPGREAALRFLRNALGGQGRPSIWQDSQLVRSLAQGDLRFSTQGVEFSNSYAVRQTIGISHRSCQQELKDSSATESYWQEAIIKVRRSTSRGASSLTSFMERRRYRSSSIGTLKVTGSLTGKTA